MGGPGEDMIKVEGRVHIGRFMIYGRQRQRHLVAHAFPAAGCQARERGKGATILGRWWLCTAMKSLCS